jgi:hypothetical protein
MNRIPKYPRTPHWPTSPGMTNDDRRHSFPEIFFLHDVVITEKLDGSNVALHGGNVYSRGTGAPSNCPWHGMVKKHHAHKTLTTNENVVLYGEDLFGVHSIKYDAIREDETFRLFGVFHMSKDRSFGWFDDFKATEQAAIDLDMLTVPTLFKGKFNNTSEISDWFEREIVKPSVLGGEREGFVIRLSGVIPIDMFSTRVCKYVRADHVQTDEHWTKNWKPCRLKR